MSCQHLKHPRSIDVHHHYFPLDIDKGKANDLACWRAPPGSLPWYAEKSIAAMDAAGIDVAILSLPSIPTTIYATRESRSRARQYNLSMKSMCTKYPSRFGLFATLPPLHDVEGALEEITYAFNELHVDGIALASSYGSGSDAKFIGDTLFEPIWAELNKHAAVVFVHGTQTPSSVPVPSPLLGLPISEVPNETFKAAAHLVVTGCKRRYPRVKVILAHLGGSTVMLAPRVAVLSEYMGSELTADQILEDFKSFYFETALSAYEPNLLALNAFTSPDKILFGTDLPAVSAKMADWYTNNLKNHFANDAEKLTGILGANALQLFPRLSLVNNDSTRNEVL
ncbi:hypothetical protein JOM56_008521 [Amanita muscaria]